MMGSKGPTQTGSTTSTQTSDPWSAQQPFLENVFNQAQSLFTGAAPQYYPYATYAPPTSAQQNALGGMEDLAVADPVTQPAINSLNGFLTGGVAASDPAMGVFNNLASGNIPGASTLQGQATYGVANPAAGTLNYYAGNNVGYSNPATPTLSAYANGDYANAGNPYTSAEAQSVLSSVVPSIQSQFIAGGDLASPQAAYATAQGATAALAPTLFSNFQQEQQNQLGAANSLASNVLQGGSLSTNAAGTLGSQALTGAGLQQGAASTLGNENLQAATGLQTAYGQNAQQQLTAEALAPQTQQMPYTDLSELYSAGATDQANQQAAINDAVARYNYGQTLPYDMLNQYIGEVTGNYGGTTTLNQPILTNPTSNALAGASVGAGLGASVLGSSGLGLTSTGVGSGIGGVLGALLTLSDRRLKADIEQVGMLNNGLPVYSYHYFGSLVPQIGVMADEVEQVHPEAVYTHPSGFKMVDYGTAVR